jgi:hypothetical protein
MDANTEITVACSICGGPTWRHAAGVEPVCLHCFAGDELLRCWECRCRASSVCGVCGEYICGGELCLRIHEHAPWPVGAAP